MAKFGELIENPVSGESVRVREITGRVIEIEWHNSAAVTLAHYHPYRSEGLAIVEGRGRYMLNAQVREGRAGDSYEVPPNTPHYHPVRVNNEPLFVLQTVEIAPSFGPADAQNLINYLERFANIAARGGAQPNGLPKNPLYAAMLLDSWQPDTYIAGLPPVLQQIGVGAAARIGHLLLS